MQASLILSSSMCHQFSTATFYHRNSKQDERSAEICLFERQKFWRNLSQPPFWNIDKSPQCFPHLHSKTVTHTPRFHTSNFLFKCFVPACFTEKCCFGCLLNFEFRRTEDCRGGLKPPWTSLVPIYWASVTMRQCVCTEHKGHQKTTPTPAKACSPYRYSICCRTTNLQSSFIFSGSGIHLKHFTTRT